MNSLKSVLKFTIPFALGYTSGLAVRDQYLLDVNTKVQMSLVALYDGYENIPPRIRGIFKHWAPNLKNKTLDP